jgi:hypothetical protein
LFSRKTKIIYKALFNTNKILKEKNKKFQGLIFFFFSKTIKKNKKKKENKKPRVWAKVAQYTWAFINKLKQAHISLVYLFFKVHITLF